METDVKFEPSGRNGVAVVGTYLFDAALRLGVVIDNECERKGNCDSCAVKITKGAELLSQPTKAELEHLSAERRKKGERLSCQAKIEKVGEITVMTTDKPKPEVPPFEAFKKELSIYKGAKGSVQFPLDKPLPLNLVTKIVKFRVKENLEKAAAKAKKKK